MWLHENILNHFRLMENNRKRVMVNSNHLKYSTMCFAIRPANTIGYDEMICQEVNAVVRDIFLLLHRGF
jgi:hypothetical protein